MMYEALQTSPYLVLHDSESWSGFRAGLKSYANLVGIPSAEEIVSRAEKVILSLRSCFERQSRPGQLQWIEAYKRHQKEISQLIEQILVESRLCGYSNIVKKVSRHRITISDSLELTQWSIEPRSFWCLYKLFDLIQIAGSQEQLIFVLRLISTLASMSKMFSLHPEEKDEDVLAQIAEMQSTQLMDSSEDYSEEIMITLNQITEEVMGDTDPNRTRWIRNFAGAVRLAKKEDIPGLKPENLKRSFASSGVSYNGKTVPSVLASLVDGSMESFPEFDRITGYIPNNTVINDPRLKKRRNYCIAIEQKKMSMRLIHIFSNKFQDRMKYFEDIRKMILRRLAADCTFNQRRGADSIHKWMSDSRCQAILSLDLHAATNTLRRDWQGVITRFMLAWFDIQKGDIDHLMNFWDKAVSLPTQIRLPHSKKVKKFSLATGQPMGLTDSFFSFAMLHHVIVMTVDRILQEKVRSIGYHIVGDDLVVALERDRENLWANLYKGIMAYMNTECNLDKGYIFNLHQRGKGKKIAEFCKYLICDGMDITPIPFGALQQATSPGGRLVLLDWLGKHSSRRVSMNDLLSFVEADTAEKQLAIWCLVTSPIDNIINSREGGIGLYFKTDPRMLPLEVAYSIQMVKEFTLVKNLMELERDPDYRPGLIDIENRKDNRLYYTLARLIGTSKLKELLGNKLMAWLEEIELKMLAFNIGLSEVFEGKTISSDVEEILPILSGISEEEVVNFLMLWSEIKYLDSLDVEERASLYMDRNYLTALSGLLSDCRMLETDNTRVRLDDNRRVYQSLDLWSMTKCIPEDLISEDIVNSVFSEFSDLGFSYQPYGDLAPMDDDIGDCEDTDLDRAESVNSFLSMFYDS